MSRLSMPLFVLLCSMAACGGGGGTTCTTDDQCPSHFCKADGTCGPASVVDAAGSGSGDASIDAPSGVCVPNHDGKIERGELPMAPGVMATFRIATNATWNTAGHSNNDGSRTWDLTGQLANDADTPVTLGAPSGAWWAADYPGATYSAVLASGSDLQGVFKLDATGLVLLGVVSPSGGATKTELMYDPPAKILAVPFQAGDTWTSTSTVTGYLNGGFGGSYTEQYDSSVDQVGTMTTPYGMFPVLRVATNLTRTSGFTTLLTKRSFSWAAECFGTVASVAGQDNATATEFSDDAEVRRLAQ